ncbi:response regulator transcription factor [Rubricoccus marinus]|uniref:DNA-binding response regulator n=1 Tax=Rubricoccus marinus TaxID=716817 RepID=A0A259U3H7_9BACT|nr:response regulator transcription factor [Rubricoccus marinus]OZC04500.1 DNA-binding response regulator [Rubricoccus marinus]
MASADSDSPTILLVDDEPDLVELLQYALENAGYRVLTAGDGEEALRIAEAERPDLAVLDIMMPKMDGIELTQQLRENAQLRLTPILMLTARAEEGDEIAGLDAGADDYVTKPVSPKKLVTRVKAMLRRVAREDEASTLQLRVHDLLIDRERYIVERPDADESFKLPRKEFELVYYLASHPDRVFTRAELLDAVWGPDVYVVDRTVDVHVRKIREKLGSQYIETVKGVGYKMVGHL